jgi:hypothetical protein
MLAQLTSTGKFSKRCDAGRVPAAHTRSVVTLQYTRPGIHFLMGELVSGLAVVFDDGTTAVSPPPSVNVNDEDEFMLTQSTTEPRVWHWPLLQYCDVYFRDDRQVLTLTVNVPPDVHATVIILRTYLVTKGVLALDAAAEMHPDEDVYYVLDKFVPGFCSKHHKKTSESWCFGSTDVVRATDTLEWPDSGGECTYEVQLNGIRRLMIQPALTLAVRGGALGTHNPDKHTCCLQIGRLHLKDMTSHSFTRLIL